MLHLISRTCFRNSRVIQNGIRSQLFYNRIDINGGKHDKFDFVVPNRKMFSDSFLGISTFIHKRNATKLSLTGADTDKMRSRIRNSFETSGLRDIFAEDIKHLLNVAENREDLELISNILRSV